MKNFITIIFISLLTTASLTAQDTLWTKTYGGESAEGGRSVCLTEDGGFAIAGYTFSFGEGNADAYLIKTDSEGNELWSKTYGGTGSDYGYSICKASSDNGFIITGYTTSYGAGSKDVYLIRTNSNGDTLWTKTFGGSGLDIGMSVSETSGGNIVICGYTESFGAGEDDIYIVKTDANGNFLWSETYGGTALETGRSICVTSQDSLVFTGATGSYGNGNQDTYTVKTDSAGNVEYEKTFGSSYYEHARAINELNSGGFIITGYSLNSLMDVYIQKIDADGNQIWKKEINGDNSFYDIGNSVYELNSGNIVVCGATKSAVTSKNDLYLLCFNSQGTVIAEAIYGGVGSDWGNSVCETNDGNILIAGYTNSYGNGSFDVWLLKIENSLPSNVGKKDINQFLNQNYPNPFSESTTIQFSINNNETGKLSIYNSTGQLIKLFPEFSAGYHVVEWNKTDNGNNIISSGIYFYQLSTNRNSCIRKMVVLK
jgi:hypothetical protein